jgi:RND family efflux transporter MFP subunit
MRLFNRRNLILFLVLAGLVAALYLWRHLGSSVLTVRVTRIQTGNLVQTFRTNGVVEPVEFQEVRAESPGRVVQARVRAGERVRAGQSLAQLDDHDFRVAVAQARSQVYEAEQSLAKLRSAGTLEQLDAQIAQARADADLAALNLRRDELLVKQKAISQMEYEETATANQKAVERLAALKKERQAQADRLQPLAEDEAKARRDQARAALRSAEVRLRAAQVPAPIAGTVLAKPPRAGTLLNPGDLLAKVGDAERLQVRAFIDQPDYSSVRIGSPVRITSNGFPGESWQGQVVSLSAELTSIGKRVVGEAVCSIDEGPSRLPVNSNVDLTFTSREVRDAQLAPIDAVFQTDGRSYVYVVSGGRLRRREVQVGPSNTQFIVIKAGLEASDMILNDLEVRPQEGMSVEPRLVTGESTP